MDNGSISPIATGIAQGLKEAIQDVEGKKVDGLKKSMVYSVQPRLIRERLKNVTKRIFKCFWHTAFNTTKLRTRTAQARLNG